MSNKTVYMYNIKSKQGTISFIMCAINQICSRAIFYSKTSLECWTKAIAFPARNIASFFKNRRVCRVTYYFKTHEALCYFPWIVVTCMLPYPIMYTAHCTPELCAYCLALMRYSCALSNLTNDCVCSVIVSKGQQKMKSSSQEINAGVLVWTYSSSLAVI